MQAVEELRSILVPGRSITAVEDGIYSVMPTHGVRPRYDRRAAAYDLVVGTQIYNRVMWGSSPHDYSRFAKDALDSSGGGLFLDAGCGSMLFTANVYAAARRPIIAFDQSLGMLRRARRRLAQLTGSVPGGICLLQADLDDLPFRPHVAETLLCLNVLHHLENAAMVIERLHQRLKPGGRLFLTSLIRNGRFVGDRYLDLLFRSGDFCRPRDLSELSELFSSVSGKEVSSAAIGNMAFLSGRSGEL